jgi:hypothetical protein
VSPCGLNGAMTTGVVRLDTITGEKLDTVCISRHQPVIDPKLVRGEKSDGQFKPEQRSGEDYSLPCSD